MFCRAGRPLSSKATSKPIGSLFSEADHGPLVCLTTIGQFISEVKNSAATTSDTIENSRVKTVENCIKARDTMLYNIAWREIDASAAQTESLPVFSVADKMGRHRIATPLNHALRWLSASGVPITDALQAEARSSGVQWASSSPMVATIKVLRKALKEQDFLHLRRAALHDSMHQLSNPKNRKTTQLIAIDVTTSDKRDRLTELGIAIKNKATGAIEAHHIIIEEHQQLMSRKRPLGSKETFLFGSLSPSLIDGVGKDLTCQYRQNGSKIMNTASALQFLFKLLRPFATVDFVEPTAEEKKAGLHLLAASQIEHAKLAVAKGLPTSSPFVHYSCQSAWVAHSVAEQLRFILQARLDSKHSRLPDSLVHRMHEYTLLRLMQQYSESNSGFTLRDMCLTLGVKDADLVSQNKGWGNAGNEAWLTLQCLLSLMDNVVQSP